MIPEWKFQKEEEEHNAEETRPGTRHASCAEALLVLGAADMPRYLSGCDYAHAMYHVHKWPWARLQGGSVI